MAGISSKLRLEHQEEFRFLADHFRKKRENKDTRYLYIPNSGNAGDSLIAEASYQFLNDLNISFTLGNMETLVEPGQHVILGGGGNLVAPYPNCRLFLERNIGRFGSLTILPHTIRAYADIIAALGDESDIFCRDVKSFDFCSENITKARVHLCHDMAFYWKCEDTRSILFRRLLKNCRDSTFRIRNAKHLYRMLRLRNYIVDGELISFRSDLESTRSEVPRYNIDISREFSTESMERGYAAAATFAMMNLVGRASRVMSDRLHVSIMAAILGKEVTIYDNNYGKNGSIFDHSMKNVYPNVSYAGSSPS